VTDLASDVTFGAATPYDKARALQDWFRSSFTYDLNVPSGHDDSAMERFLFVTRRGYCEQFAGTYAAMARSLGLPARVGVGFTSGTKQGDGTFHVTGKEAHAWPEVYFPGSGWIPFEPTPGRAAPSGESYTGVDPSAASSPEATRNAPATTTPAGVATTQPATNPPTTQAQATPPTPAATAPPVDASGGGGGGPSAVVLAVLAIVVLAVAYLVGVPLLRRRRRARLRVAATTPTTQVILAWSEAKEDLSLAGVRPAAAETANEFAVRAGQESDEIAHAMNDLAQQWAAACYSPDGVGGAAGERALTAAETVRSDLAGRASTVRRLAWLFDPRPLLRGQGAT
jgi:hypothetical protein